MNTSDWTDYLYIAAAEYEALPESRRDDLKRAVAEQNVTLRVVEAERTGAPRTLRFYAQSLATFKPIRDVLRANGIKGNISEGHILKA